MARMVFLKPRRFSRMILVALSTSSRQLSSVGDFECPQTAHQAQPDGHARHGAPRARRASRQAGDRHALAARNRSDGGRRAAHDARRSGSPPRERVLPHSFRPTVALGRLCAFIYRPRPSTQNLLSSKRRRLTIRKSGSSPRNGSASRQNLIDSGFLRGYVALRLFMLPIIPSAPVLALTAIR